MIRFLLIFAAVIALTGSAALAQDVYLKGGEKKASQGAAPVYNAPAGGVKGSVYKGASQSQQKKAPDLMAQLMEENRQADYEIVKKKSLETKEKIMKANAEREAIIAQQKKAEEAMMAGGTVQTPETVAPEEQKEETKKVYVYKKTGGVQAPKKVFNSYD